MKYFFKIDEDADGLVVNSVTSCPVDDRRLELVYRLGSHSTEDKDNEYQDSYDSLENFCALKNSLTSIYLSLSEEDIDDKFSNDNDGLKFNDKVKPRSKLSEYKNSDFYYRYKYEERIDPRDILTLKKIDVETRSECSKESGYSVTISEDNLPVISDPVFEFFDVVDSDESSTNTSEAKTNFDKCSEN